MTYEKLVEEVKEGASRVEKSKLTDHLAIQVNIEGEAEGAFYIEIQQGNIVVAPYEYYDRDILLICQATQILAILKGEMDPMKALSDGQIRAEGNVGRLGLFAEIIRKTSVRKEAKKVEKEEPKTVMQNAEKEEPKIAQAVKKEEPKAVEKSAEKKGGKDASKSTAKATGSKKK